VVRNNQLTLVQKFVCHADALVQQPAWVLAQIEDETHAGGRDVAPDLNQHWKRCLSQDYGLPPPDLQACRLAGSTQLHAYAICAPVTVSSIGPC